MSRRRCVRVRVRVRMRGTSPTRANVASPAADLPHRSVQRTQRLIGWTCWSFKSAPRQLRPLVTSASSRRPLSAVGIEFRIQVMAAGCYFQTLMLHFDGCCFEISVGARVSMRPRWSSVSSIVIRSGRHSIRAKTPPSALASDPFYGAQRFI